MSTKLLDPLVNRILQKEIKRLNEHNTIELIEPNTISRNTYEPKDSLVCPQNS